MTIYKRDKIKKLMNCQWRDGVFFSRWLRSQGYSASLLESYRKGGWLESLCPGAMVIPGIRPTCAALLSCYNGQMGTSYRVSADTALALSGSVHFVPLGGRRMMVSYPGGHLPKCFSLGGYDREFKFFSTKVFQRVETWNYEIDGWPVCASSRELAIMECILLAPDQYSYMDVYYLFEMLGDLRPDVIQELLEHCTSMRVRRVFLYMAKKRSPLWLSQLDVSRISLGAGTYQLCEGGMYIPEYKITLPRELIEYE